ncbi:MAG: RNA 2',3'-cyclic phosphodiesterase [Clostridia bacterium]|nr:RNA 2',3'-cyclic phosphodiesterase [Clostridia bacterium]
MLRLFWVVNLAADVKQAVGRFQGELKNLKSNAKWVEQENLHLTVKFLGDVKSGLVPGVVMAVRSALAGERPFDLHLTGCGSFGKPLRVLWVGVRGETRQFTGLVRRVEEGLTPLGFVSENGKTTPHLTIARLRSPDGAGPLLERIATAATQGLQFGVLTVDRIDLMQSTLSRSGPQYTVLESVRLSLDH